MKNPNHPKKGSSCKVQPIKTIEDIQRVKDILIREQDKCLFICGINMALRASDLTNFRIEQVKDLKPMDTVEIKERKTGKIKNVVFNGVCITAINNLVKEREKESQKELQSTSSNYLFQGRNGTKATTIYLNSLMKKWTKKAGLKGNYGSHSLRKTWATIALREFKVPLADVMHSLNHSNMATTMKYLGINSETVVAAFSNEL